MKILLIEDDKGLRTGISFALSQEGYEVWEAGTAREGYDLFKREQPKAVLMDLNLPDMDGILLCRKIRENSRVPVLMGEVWKLVYGHRFYENMGGKRRNRM